MLPLKPSAWGTQTHGAFQWAKLQIKTQRVTAAKHDGSVIQEHLLHLHSVTDQFNINVSYRSPWLKHPGLSHHNDESQVYVKTMYITMYLLCICSAIYCNGILTTIIVSVCNYFSNHSIIHPFMFYLFYHMVIYLCALCATAILARTLLLKKLPPEPEMALNSCF